MFPGPNESPTHNWIAPVSGSPGRCGQDGAGEGGHAPVEWLPEELDHPSVKAPGREKQVVTC